MFSFNPQHNPSTQNNFILNNLIPVKAAAEMTGYNIQYLRRMLRNGKIQGVKVGQMWMIDVEFLRMYLLQAVKTEDKRFGPQVDQGNSSILG